jgi:uncharacterized damage-inducible protein DinB
MAGSAAWFGGAAMSDVTTRLEIVPIWRRLIEMLVELADHVPDDQLDWSPKPELWGFRRILLHVADARQEWMVRAINDGERDIAGIPERRTRPEIQDALRRTWERVERTLADQARLDATYRDRWWKEAPPRTGHWVAFHLLEHDVHHRADLLLYLAMLGVETPRVWTP